MNSLDRLGPTAASQLGLLTRRQLLGAGFDNNAIEAAVRSGDLYRARRGVYATAPVDGSRHQRIVAACLLSNTWAAASHLCAASLWDLWTSDQIEISIPHPAKASVPDVTVHRSRDLDRAHVTRIDRVPVTTPTRTICDLGLVLPEFEVHRVLDHALAIGLVDVDEVAVLRKRIGRPGRNGAGMIRRAIESRPAGIEAAESGPEIALLRVLATSALPEVHPQYWIDTPGGRFRADLAMPTHRIAIEYDGEAWHSSASQIEADGRRQCLIEAEGWTVVRATAADLSPEGLVAFRGRVLDAVHSRR